MNQSYGYVDDQIYGKITDKQFWGSDQQTKSNNVDDLIPSYTHYKLLNQKNNKTFIEPDNNRKQLIENQFKNGNMQVAFYIPN